MSGDDWQRLVLSQRAKSNESSSAAALPPPPTAVAITTIRRRRKRSLPGAGDENFQRSTKSPSFSVPSDLDDASLTFLDNNGDFLNDRHAVASSVSILLEERQTGRWTGRQKSWQYHTLKNHVKKPLVGQPRRQWRPFAKRQIPFTQLGTSTSDAVLALDRQGSFILSLGSKDCRNAPLALALRFYGIPSPQATLAQRRERVARSQSAQPRSSTLLQTIPLLYEIVDESPEEAIFSFRRGISPATTPVKIIMSSDWRMGVAIFQPSTVWREVGPVGMLVLFSTPNGRSFHSSRTTVWQCSNVKMGVDSSFSPRNLLWRVFAMPKAGGELPVGIQNVPGYLFFNDEDDGFRLTWALEKWGVDEMTPWSQIAVLESSPLSKGVVSGADILSFENTWERFDSHLWSGNRILPAVGDPAGVSVVCEAFLHIDVLLNDILSRRKGMAGSRPSDFVYNLISVTNAGRVAELVITFMRTQRPGSLGVFVKVDLFTGKYEESNWMKNASSCDTFLLRNWCNALALNHRMKGLRVGPYAVRPNHAIDWSKLCTEKSFDPDEDDDFSSSFWKDYVQSDEAIATRKPPKFISLSLLYPDCDLVTNKAITECVPVSSLRGKDSPTELVYG